MEQNNSKKFSKSLIIAICAGALALTFLLVYFLAIFKAPTRGSDNLTLEIVYSNTTYTYKIKTNLKYENVEDANGVAVRKSTTTVYDILVEQNTPLNLKFVAPDSPYGGKYVTSLKGTAEVTDEMIGYLYTVNGESPMLDISKQTVKSGDAIKFRYGIASFDDVTWAETGFEFKAGKKLVDAGQILFYPVIVISVFLVGFAALEINNHFRTKKLAEAKSEADGGDGENADSENK